MRKNASLDYIKNLQNDGPYYFIYYYTNTLTSEDLTLQIIKYIYAFIKSYKFGNKKEKENSNNTYKYGFKKKDRCGNIFT